MPGSLDYVGQEHARGLRVRQLLAEARSAIAAGNGDAALEYVMEALQLLAGREAILPALRQAADRARTSQVANDELAALLSQVTLQAEEAVQQQSAAAQAGQHHPQSQGWQQQQQQQLGGPPMSLTGSCILQETGREAFTEVAMSDGSSWQCPRCGGVVPVGRRQQHEQHWCPAATGSTSSQ